MSTWKCIQWTSRFRDGSNGDAPFNNILAITAGGIPNANDRTANNLVNFWYERACGFTPDPAIQSKLAEFMSYDDNTDPVIGNLDAPIDIYDNNWPGYNTERLFAVVSTIFLTAEFSYR